MRTTLLVTVAALGTALAAPSFAQTSPTQYTPMQSAPSDAITTPPERMAAPAPAPHHAWRHHQARANTGSTTAGLDPETGARPGHTPGVGDSQPMSTHASNINPNGSHSEIAPRLPTPAGGENASARIYLHDAAQALNRGQTGTAQEALERAETAFLNNPANPADPTTGGPVGGPMQQSVEHARQALGQGDTAQAKQIIGDALAQTSSGPTDNSVGASGMGGTRGMPTRNPRSVPGSNSGM